MNQNLKFDDTYFAPFALSKKGIKKKINPELNKGEIIIYQAKDGPRLEVRLEKDTVWLTHKQMAILFDQGVPTINEHIKNIFKERELDEKSVIWKFRIVQIGCIPWCWEFSG